MYRLFLPGSAVTPCSRATVSFFFPIFGTTVCPSAVLASHWVPDQLPPIKNGLYVPGKTQTSSPGAPFRSFNSSGLL